MINQKSPKPKPSLKTKGNLRCPHCGRPGEIRSSREVAITIREIFYQCTTIECGHTWRASLIYDHGIVPSAKANPELSLKAGSPNKNQSTGPPEEQLAPQPE